MLGGVTGNARLTGSVGAAIFLALAAEGVTILRVRELISFHVFLGMLVVPLVLVKTASTVYRVARYYRGRPDYVAKGPPPLLLRLLGPVVVVTTFAVLATGLAALAAGPSTRWLVQIHKASFIVWFAAMTIHVLGHILETPALALGDWRRSRSRVPGSPARISVLIIACATGLVLATLSLGWTGSWHRAHSSPRVSQLELGSSTRRELG